MCDPDNSELVHDRLVSLNRVGDAQVLLNDFQAAQVSFQAMVDAGNRLMEVDPYSTGWAYDLSLGLQRLGDAQARNGDLPGALKSHQDCLNLRDWLVKQDGSSTVWYRSLAISYKNVADILARQNDFATALANQQQSLALMRDLAAAFPDDPWYKIDVIEALDVTSTLLQDGTAENQEALDILLAMQASGTLPEGYEDWIPAFRKTLGLPPGP